MSKHFNIGTDSIRFNLIVMHKIFGWFFFIGFGVIGFLFSQDILSILFAVVSFWSIRRKPEINWSSKTKSWTYSNRNYFKTYERKFALFPEDTLEVSYKRTKEMRHDLLVHFKPQEEPDKINDFIGGCCLLPISMEDGIEPLRALIKIYYDSGIMLKVDLSRLYETHDDEVVNNLYRDLYAGYIREEPPHTA